ncbi:hypothetical protein C8R47DRAFT_1164058 [Mycena vitilis]|nr:hypothetical protein C8R47DRAFT_1164058 [Mycena vitilis]
MGDVAAPARLLSLRMMGIGTRRSGTGDGSHPACLLSYFQSTSLIAIRIPPPSLFIRTSFPSILFSDVLTVSYNHHATLYRCPHAFLLAPPQGLIHHSAYLRMTFLSRYNLALHLPAVHVSSCILMLHERCIWSYVLCLSPDRRTSNLPPRPAASKYSFTCADIVSTITCIYLYSGLCVSSTSLTTAEWSSTIHFALREFHFQSDVLGGASTDSAGGEDRPHCDFVQLGTQIFRPTTCADKTPCIPVRVPLDTAFSASKKQPATSVTKSPRAILPPCPFSSSLSPLPVLGHASLRVPFILPPAGMRTSCGEGLSGPHRSRAPISRGDDHLRFPL